MSTSHRRPFHFLTFAEMISEPSSPEWLIRDYLEAFTLSVLFGESGAMKTFVALQMAFCIASGLPWYGNKVHRPGPVCYIAGEGIQGLRKRLKALAVAHKVDVKTLPLFTASEPAQFLDATSAEAVSAAVATLVDQHGAPQLVVIDTLNRCFGPGDENSTADMTAFVAALDHLRNRFRCAVLVIHHSGLGDSNRARGSSALRAALDFEYCLKGTSGIRVLSCSKAKDHEPPLLLSLSPEPVSTGWIDPETGQEIMSCLLRQVGHRPSMGKPLSGQNLTAFKALEAVCAENGRALIDTWREESYKQGITNSSGQGSRQRAFNRAFTALLEGGYVEADAETNYYRPKRCDEKET